jgi:hypothetical protein
MGNREVNDDGIDVAGPLTMSLEEFKHRCALHIREEQNRVLSNNALIATLCDGVRFAREFAGERCVIGKFCSEHGFVHGEEAENLRHEIENTIGAGFERHVADGTVSPRDAVDSALRGVEGVLQEILDRVDARDSLAFLEADERRAREEILSFLDFADGRNGNARQALDSYFAHRPPVPLRYHEHRQPIYKAPHPEQEGVVDEKRCSKVSSDLTERLINETSSPLEAFIVTFMVLKMLPHVVEALLGLTPEQTADIVEEAHRIVHSVTAAVEPRPFTGKGGEG